MIWSIVSTGYVSIHYLPLPSAQTTEDFVKCSHFSHFRELLSATHLSSHCPLHEFPLEGDPEQKCIRVILLYELLFHFLKVLISTQMSILSFFRHCTTFFSNFFCLQRVPPSIFCCFATKWMLENSKGSPLSVFLALRFFFENKKFSSLQFFDVLRLNGW